MRIAWGRFGITGTPRNRRRRCGRWRICSERNAGSAEVPADSPAKASAVAPPPEPPSRLAAGRNGAAAGRESGPAGALDGPDSHGESAAGERHRRARRLGWPDRRNGGGMRPVSQGLGRASVAAGESAGILFGDPPYRIRRTEGPLAGRAVEDGASAATTQRLEHAAFGGATPAGRVERSHGPGGRLVRRLSKDGAGPGRGRKTKKSISG